MTKDDRVAQTYSAMPPIEGRKFTCKRCGRVYAYPEVNGGPIRCECGWWYWNDHGKIRDAFRQRIDPPPS
ncbi:MAG: hypothetical protein JO024_06255 [Candidatus Eremiobacteraeota bacterium]|nr:hypothetical protein [Candidatus Eremiobacteraeota bacterium]